MRSVDNSCRTVSIFNRSNVTDWREEGDMICFITFHSLILFIIKLYSHYRLDIFSFCVIKPSSVRQRSKQIATRTEAVEFKRIITHAPCKEMNVNWISFLVRVLRMELMI